MAIKGVSDIKRLPRLGKIRLGEKDVSKRTGQEYPKAVDYFVCPPEVQKVYGEKPRALDIMFPVEDEEIFFPQWYKRYGSSTGLFCKGDGERATAIDPETGGIQETECCPDECEWFLKKHCRRLANIRFLLPRVPGLGVWQINTTSFHSIVNLNSVITMIRGVTGGRIRMIPLKLTLKSQEVTPGGKKKIVYVLDLVAPFTLDKLINFAQKALPEFTVDKPDDNDRPEDLYPDAVLNKEDPEPFTLDAQTAEPPVQKTIPQASAGNGKTKKEQKAEQATADRAAATQTDAHKQFIAETDALLEKELHATWDKLGTPHAKRKAQLAKPNLDKEKLLEALRAEIQRREEAEVPAAQAPPLTVAQPAQ